MTRIPFGRACLVVLLLASGVAAAEPERGLIGWWKLDGRKQGVARDASGHGHDGKLLNEPLAAPGIVGGCVELDGKSQAVRIPHSPGLKPAGQLTLSAWVLPESLTGFHDIFRKEDGEDRLLLSFQEKGDVLSLGLRAGGTYAELDVKIRPADFTDGRWHLVTGTYDGQVKWLYVDGRQIGSAPASGPLGTGGTADAFLGSLHGTVEFFHGYIDDVRLYGRALAPKEVEALYQARAADVAKAGQQTRQAGQQARRDAEEARRAAEKRYAPLRKAARAAWRKARAAKILQPLDLEARARRVMAGYMTQVPRRVPGPEGYYRAVFVCRLLPRPLFHFDRWDYGDCTGRAVLAWTAVREMTGDSRTGADVEEGQRRFLLSLLNPKSGLVFVPNPENAAKGVFYYHIWDQSRTLRALVRWYETRPADRQRLRPLIDRMIAGLESRATVRGTDPQWGPYAGWPSDEFTDKRPGPVVGWVNVRGGLCIEPLVEYAELTGDAKALDLAVRFANCEMGHHEGDAAPPEKKREFGFGPDGSFVGHLHSKTSTLIGLAKLGRCLARRGQRDRALRYLAVARRSYDWILAPKSPVRSSRIGWIVEGPGAGHSELCCAADMIELAEALASCCDLAPELHDWANLHDDVESMTVNTVVRVQICLTPEMEKCLATQYGDDAAKLLPEARKFDGVVSSTYPPNDLSHPGPEVVIGGCCAYAGVRGLYAGWRDAMTFSDGRLRVNNFLARRSPQATITTAMPKQGEATIALRAACRVSMRVPSWLSPEKLSLEVDGRPVKAAGHLDETGHYVTLGLLPAGTKIAVRFPVEDRVTKETMAGTVYTLRWRGNYVIGMEPPGPRFPYLP